MSAWKRAVVALGLFLVFTELAAKAQQAAGDLGTISSTNIRAHQAEVGYKISGHLNYQNLFYVIQPFASLSGLAVNTPLQKRTFRFQSQMLFSF